MPPAVREAVTSLLTSNNSDEDQTLDFFWLISDVSSLTGPSGMTINLSHHSWFFPDEVFPEVMNGRRIEVPLRAGAFTYPGSGIAAFSPDPCLALNCLSSIPMTIHPQRGRGGGLCCSPNNARVVLSRSHGAGGSASTRGLSNMWTVAGVQAGRDWCARIVVTLQWIIHEPVMGLAEALSSCRTLKEVLMACEGLVGHDHPAVSASRLMFGLVADDDLAVMEAFHQVETMPCYSVPRGRGGNGGQLRGRGTGGAYRGGGRGRGRMMAAKNDAYYGDHGATFIGKDIGTAGDGVAATATSNSGGQVVCSMCHRSLDEGRYSKTQLKKQEQRKCKACALQSGNSSSASLVGGGEVRLNPSR